jgi:hypothetical protein
LMSCRVIRWVRYRKHNFAINIRIATLHDG